MTFRSSSVALFLVFSVLGCGGEDEAPPADPGPTTGAPRYDRPIDGVSRDVCLDHDGDGSFASCISMEMGPDCDDADPNAYPGAPELCNEVDDDCDGVIDNDSGAPLCALSCTKPQGGCEKLVKVAAANDHACVLTEGGRVACFGKATDWQYMPGIVGAKDIVASGGRTCAVLDDTHAACWSLSSWLPIAFIIESPMAAMIDDALCVAADSGLSCYVLDHGNPAEPSVVGYGDSTRKDNIAGRGDTVCMTSGYDGEEAATSCYRYDDQFEPRLVYSGDTASTGLVSVGNDACYFEKEGGVACGLSDPMPIPGTDSAVELSAGIDIACVRAEDGRVSCFEGEGPTEELRFAHIAAGGGFACGITMAGELECWGSYSGTPVSILQAPDDAHGVLNGSATPIAACDSVADLGALLGDVEVNVNQSITTCHAECMDSLDPDQCFADCFVLKHAVSAACATCMADFADCTDEVLKCAKTRVECAGL